MNFMELNVATFLIVCPLVFIAGMVDAIAGGGGLISLPAYLLAGIPMHFALGTNKLSSIAGAVVSSTRYYRNRLVDIMLCIPSIAAALLGSTIGTSLTLVVDEGILEKLLLVILPVTFFYVFKKKDLNAKTRPISRKKALVYSVLISLVIGGYDGFFGPGAGTFYILLYTGIAKIDPPTASGNAKFMNLASNLAALAIFLFNRRVIIVLGLCAGLFSIAGAYIGAGLVIRKGTKVVRYFILFVLVLLFIKTGYDILTKFEK